VRKCQTAHDTDCFKLGGYTSAGVPEVMVINEAQRNGLVPQHDDGPRVALHTHTYRRIARARRPTSHIL